MSKVAVIMVVRNEEKRLAVCLEKLRWADEIIVMDQASDDQTAAIARHFTDKVYNVSNKGYCEPDRKLAVSMASSDWIFYCDPDEIVSPELAQEIKNAVNKPAFEAYSVLRKNYIFGRLMRFGGHQNDWQLRLFKKGVVTYTDRIHEKPSVAGETGKLGCALSHYSTESLVAYCRKLDNYTNIEVDCLLKEGREFSSKRLVFEPMLRFFRQYFWQQGFRDGREGFIFYCLSAFYIFLKYAKLWERTVLPKK